MDETQTENLARQRAEDRSSQLERELFAERITRDLSSQKNIRLTSKVKRLTKRLAYSNNEVKKAMSVLCRLYPGPAHTNGEEVVDFGWKAAGR